MRVPASAAHGSQKLAGNHMLLTLGPDKKEEARGDRRERREEGGGEEVGLWERREGRVL